MTIRPEDIVYEDNHLIAINKASGILVQGDITGDTPLLDLTKAYIKKKYNKPGDVYLGLPHRLDRPTSGIVLFCKTSKALTRVNKLFETREIKKKYWAIVKNKPVKESALLSHFLIRNPAKNKSTAWEKEKKNSKKAELNYKIILKLDNYYLLEVMPKTGRHHQIRSQLSAINCPIKGDLKYGFDRSNKDGSISLHARSLHFIHPISLEPITILAKPNFNDPTWKSCSRFT